MHSIESFFIIFYVGSVVEKGRLNGIASNLIRVLAKKYRIEVNWVMRGQTNTGFSTLDQAVRKKYIILIPASTNQVHLSRF